jgi:hypothetical protein
LEAFSLYPLQTTVLYVIINHANTDSSLKCAGFVYSVIILEFLLTILEIIEHILCEAIHKYYLTIIYEFHFPVEHNNIPITLAHISLCITEIIGHTMSLHVSAHRAIIRRYITNLVLLNYASYMDPYIVLIFVCYSTLAFANHLYMHRLGGCVLYCFKTY